MKFKIDENLPFSIKKIIESSGNHTVDSVFHEHLTGTDDKTLLQHCFTESRVLITLDTDFTHIDLLKNQKSYGIILLRPVRQGKRAVNDLLKIFISNYNISDSVGKIIVVNSNEIKVRPILNS